MPRLVIIVTTDNPVIDTYVRLKKRYGQDLLVDVVVHRVSLSETPKLIKSLNKDKTVHGIIVQLPLADPTKTEEIINLVDVSKDVDALGAQATFEPATPMAIMWLLAGYNIDLRGKQVLLVGRGKLVGTPLLKLLHSSGIEAQVVDSKTANLIEQVKAADVVITATGSPGSITSNMLKNKAVVIDAGVASEDGKTVGDVAPDVYTRDDLIITPAKGGVGPLTVCALFENVIRAARLV